MCQHCVDKMSPGFKAAVDQQLARHGEQLDGLVAEYRRQAAEESDLAAVSTMLTAMDHVPSSFATSLLTYAIRRLASQGETVPVAEPVAEVAEVEDIDWTMFVDPDDAPRD